MGKIPTLNEAFEEYMRERIDLRQGSRNTYINTYKTISPEVGEMHLDEIRFSDLRRMYTRLRFENGLKPRSIELLNNIINPIFETAVQDELLTRNPNHGALKAASKGDAWRKTNRPAVKADDQIAFMKFVHESDIYRRWENFFIFLFGTGCRIGETIGIRWEDVDFDKGIITINHTTQYLDGEFVTGPPKSGSGNRTIPMLDEVRAALLKEKLLAMLTQIERDGNVPGERGYIFRNHRGTIHHPSSVNQTIHSIVEEHNRLHPDSPITDFTSVHQTRHTFATRLCENDVNLKVIQSVMGHADISLTLDIYAQVSEEKKRRELEALGGKILGKES